MEFVNEVYWDIEHLEESEDFAIEYPIIIFALSVYLDITLGTFFPVASPGWFCIVFVSSVVTKSTTQDLGGEFLS